ncbi:MAG: TerB family tellurite resistance protein [Pseudomonadota bacterium]
MFGDLLKSLMAPEPEPLPDPDARVAMAALLVRVARSDGDYAKEEVAHIDRVLAARYGLGPFEATALRGRGETLENQAPDTVRFTRALKDVIPYEERVSVIEALWEIALADGERDGEEDSVLRMVASFLGINDHASNAARLRVQQRMAG